VRINHTPEQLKRAQRNGGRKKNGYRPSGADKVIAAIERHGPMVPSEIAVAADRKPTTLPMLLNIMLAESRLIVIGTAEQAGKQGVRKHARVFALPGTPMLPPVMRIVDFSEPARVQNICRPYEYEWRPLKRNAHEHAQLAMLTRR
jgi:hypothetical protein